MDKNELITVSSSTQLPIADQRIKLELEQLGGKRCHCTDKKIKHQILSLNNMLDFTGELLKGTARAISLYANK